MNAIQILIYIHAGLGGIALLSGFGAGVTIKGGEFHKRFGAIFHNTMLASIVISLVVAMLPGHFNPFLFSIGIFSAYATRMGKRVLKTHRPDFYVMQDRILIIIMAINSLAMIFVPIVYLGQINWILFIFGIMGIISAYIDWQLFQDLEKIHTNRVRLHLNKIIGGYIAAITAFIVVNKLLPGYWAWFFPTIIGTIYAIYWNRRHAKK